MRDLKENIPVIFIHSGNQEYLRYAIKSAENANNDVYLIGDKSNMDFTKKHYLIDDYKSEEFDIFDNVYEHMSSNSEWFEKICFERYFILRKFMESNNLDKAFMIDSDVLSYINYSYLNMSQVLSGILIPQNQDGYRWSAAPSISYWTLSGVKDFIDYCIMTYKNNKEELYEKYKYHIDNRKKGGICDMTLLYLWSKSRGKKVKNLLCIDEGIIDFNINTPENYLKRNYKYNKILKIKKVIFKDNKAYFKKDDNSLELVLALHFQGIAKEMMGAFYLKNKSIIKVKRIKSFINRTLKFIKRVEV